MRRLLPLAIVIAALLVAACSGQTKTQVTGIGIEGDNTADVDAPVLINVIPTIVHPPDDEAPLLEEDLARERRDVKNYTWTVTPSDSATVGPSDDPRAVAFAATKPGVYVITAVGSLPEVKGMSATLTVTVLAPSPSPAQGATDPTAATAAPPTGSPEPTTEPTISFLLSDGKVPAAASSDVPGFGAAIAELEIRGASGAEGSPVPITGSVPKVPVSADVGFTFSRTDTHGVLVGTGGLSMAGTMDPTTGAVTGTFTWKVPALTITSDVTSGGVVAGQATMTISLTWSGDVTGTVDADTADLSFAGSMTSTCKTTTTAAELHNVDCTGPTGAASVPATFAVRIESATPSP